MLVNIHHDSPAEHRRLLVAGVAFLAILGLLLSFCVAVYAKVFESSTTVVVEAERAGLQLAKFGDVRMNGSPRVTLTLSSKPSAFAGMSAWS